jgi:KipI family sensor histidine kinase inhibitor
MAGYEQPLFLPAGDVAIVVEFGDEIDPAINRRVQDLASAIDATPVAGVFDLMPTYRSLLVYYDPSKTTYGGLTDDLRRLADRRSSAAVSSRRTVHIPTMYGGECGPDIEFVASSAGLSVAEVIEIHSGQDYLIYAMGFAPGFPYLGGLSRRLETPRLQTPRTAIPAGSVGIAGTQTGIYPLDSPGGWQLIGRTPLRMFDPNREPPVPYQSGDYIRFVPIASQREYDAIRQADGKGEYRIEVTVS